MKRHKKRGKGKLKTHIASVEKGKKSRKSFFPLISCRVCVWRGALCCACFWNIASGFRRRKMEKFIWCSRGGEGMQCTDGCHPISLSSHQWFMLSNFNLILVLQRHDPFGSGAFLFYFSLFILSLFILSISLLRFVQNNLFDIRVYYFALN